jgi:dTDP-glucose 4,6-dehydratase
LTRTSQRVVYRPLPKDDPTQRQPDITKARAILGWEPKVSRSQGLRITYEYFQGLPREEWYRKEHKDFEDYSRRPRVE